MEREDGLTLREWLIKHNVNKEEEQKNYMKLFYLMDLSMRNLHDNGYYIENFNIENIIIRSNGVEYKSLGRLYPEDKDYLIHRNIYYLSCLALGSYNNCLDYINPENKNLLREVYPDFSSFIPDDVKPYYKGIFERDANVYLSDFVDAKRKRDMDGLQSTLDSFGGGKGATYSKSTLAGRLMDTDNNVAAFGAVYVFPAIMFLMALLIPILIIIGK